jgi:hypothetical protein
MNKITVIRTLIVYYPDGTSINIETEEDRYTTDKT